MAGAHPEEHVARPAIRQSWRRVAFLHWRFDPEVIAPLLPAHLSPDVIDGSAWVSLTPFQVEAFRVLELPAIPGLSSFPETNVRTYVRHDRGEEGIFFLSIDVGSLSNVAGGRLGGVRYFPARMTVDATDDAGGQTIRYRSRRLIGPAAMHDITVRPTAPLRPVDNSPLVDWLTGRWRAFSSVAGRIVVVPNEHEPWPLMHADIVGIDETLLSAAGLPAPVDAPLAHYSEGVNAKLGPPRSPRPLEATGDL